MNIHERVDRMEFVECPACATKPGTAVLCNACGINRSIIDKLKTPLLERIEKLEKGNKIHEDIKEMIVADNETLSALKEMAFRVEKLEKEQEALNQKGATLESRVYKLSLDDIKAIKQMTENGKAPVETEKKEVIRKCCCAGLCALQIKKRKMQTCNLAMYSLFDHGCECLVEETV